MIGRNALTALLASACWSLAGCAKTPCEGLEARISVSTAGTKTDRVVAEVSAAELPRPRRLLLARGGDRAEGVLCVDAGSQRVVEIRAYDRGGRMTHVGRAMLDVTSAVPAIEAEVAARLGGAPVALRIEPRERAGALTRAPDPAP